MKTGCNMRILLQQAPALGIQVEKMHCSGELRLAHPNVSWRCRVSAVRKDSSRAATSFFHEVQRLANLSNAHHVR